MKYLLILTSLFLCACEKFEFVEPDNESHYIEWPTGRCHGKVSSVAVSASEWVHAVTQFIARCDDGRTVYNLSNFTVSNSTVSR